MANTAHTMYGAAAAARVTTPLTSTTQPATPAPRARTMPPAEKLQRSLQIAEHDHLLYRARLHPTNDAGERVFSVPSRTQPGLFHVVRLTPTGAWCCGCPAGEHGLPCGHVGAAFHLWRQIEQAMSEAGMRAQRAYESFGAWLDQRQY